MLTLYKVDNFYLLNCKMGQKAISFYRTNNKRQGRKERKCWFCWGHIDNRFGGMRKHRVGLMSGDWMTCYNAFLIKQSIY